MLSAYTMAMGRFLRCCMVRIKRRLIIAIGDMPILFRRATSANNDEDDGVLDNSYLVCNTAIPDWVRPLRLYRFCDATRVTQLDKPGSQLFLSPHREKCPVFPRISNFITSY